jgi:hypothetical protein
MDTRTVEQNQRLEEKFGRIVCLKNRHAHHTINTLQSCSGCASLSPQLWKEAERFMLYDDFSDSQDDR